MQSLTPQNGDSLGRTNSDHIQHSGFIPATVSHKNIASTSSTAAPLPDLFVNLSKRFQDAVEQVYPPSILGAVADDSGEAVAPVRSLKLVSGQLPALVIPTKESHSQMFAYAYGQIEKERAFGFKDADQEGQPGEVLLRKKRFEIELAFEELSMVLKGSGKKILCNVTGKLSPGRITAIMGPSGAGKTTFLNGLAGKSTNTRTTGQVLINGKPGSVYSYKRIIGFVPQDDIVHGSLTVEENLWFSASYRYISASPSTSISQHLEGTLQCYFQYPKFCFDS
jgi:ABC-type multidrug transport system fused ATPase/permease subunit